MPKYAPIKITGNEQVQYASLDDMCAAKCGRLFIHAGELVVKSNIDTFHLSCAQEWCNAHEVPHNFRTQFINEFDLTTATD